ncbi:hypothetical protein FB567DRAFT_548423 [Paraphoma chrysanthemicola]|uniref:Uncharacterized protein n=1 Tax=Paraphoma chrysanthemicola TaxID=798071 RepID=A0A8K0VZI1_9PLEO|nr:hypothetical protein FB567DRAFT_548423 [Paraphoma chrysanthemicola]
MPNETMTDILSEVMQAQKEDAILFDELSSKIDAMQSRYRERGNLIARLEQAHRSEIDCLKREHAEERVRARAEFDAQLVETRARNNDVPCVAGRTSDMDMVGARIELYSDMSVEAKVEVKQNHGTERKGNEAVRTGLPVLGPKPDTPNERVVTLDERFTAAPDSEQPPSHAVRAKSALQGHLQHVKSDLVLSSGNQSAESNKLDSRENSTDNDEDGWKEVKRRPQRQPREVDNPFLRQRIRKETTDRGLIILSSVTDPEEEKRATWWLDRMGYFGWHTDPENPNVRWSYR